MRTLFMNDWHVAVRSHDLAWYIVKVHHDPGTWKDIDRNGVHDEVDEVREQLWRHHRLLYNTFDFYSALYSENENSPGEPDVFNMSFNAYMNVVERTRMISKGCSIGELSLSFFCHIPVQALILHSKP